MSENFPCWYPVQIRFRDLDPLAHVNNTVYFTYFEEARSYYFNQLHSWLEQWPSGEEQQEAESIVSHPPHIQRIKTRPFRRHYALLLNRGREELGLHPGERAGLSKSLFAEHGLPRFARQTVLSKKTFGRWLSTGYHKSFPSLCSSFSTV